MLAGIGNDSAGCSFYFVQGDRPGLYVWYSDTLGAGNHARAELEIDETGISFHTLPNEKIMPLEIPFISGLMVSLDRVFRSGAHSKELSAERTRVVMDAAIINYDVSEGF
jgi:hypothetical protein